MSEPEIFSDADSKCEVSKVGLPMRCPPFCPEEPAVWFAQIEGQFVLGRISSDTTKFYTVVTQLETKYAMQVKDIITKPPETNKYEKLKTELINRLSASQEKQIQQLLIHEELGDRPSQFLRHLQNLAGPAGASDFVKSLWTNRLPQNIQTVIASQIADLPVEKLAEIADRVYDIVPCTPQVTATSASTSTAPDLVKEVSELTKQVARLSSQMNSKWRGRSRSRSQSRHNQRRYYRGRSNNSRTPQPPPNHPHCYYHYTFGDKANKCRQPCTFTSENAKGGR
ncbi:uncharacterized protein LOC124637188 [Helicoverpa zea]|uniref:uncharacterized protein LOC124637188 n=1 Tax=Helicoverpa zea TaxID=7113 RepID=UPI001F5ACE36|nr:uncharacterized protein LOC124637188 [Helicoverpa zea]